ncbi:hypothetical protein T08_15812 [Trichinella sp. T8]|nr:hypothetical protein T08_15812 [Trichinella sp. T8]
MADVPDLHLVPNHRDSPIRLRVERPVRKNGENLSPSRPNRHYFHPTLLKHIVEESHDCAAKCNGKFQITETELELFLRTLLKKWDLLECPGIRCTGVAPSSARFIRTIYYVESARRISTPMHTALLRSPHTDFTLPPVALQKGKRDAQVQFRGRRHNNN